MSIVLKFGGSSQTVEHYPVIRDRIIKLQADGNQVVVVLSAIQNTTDLLFQALHHNPRAMKELVQQHQILCHNLGIPKGANAVLDELQKLYHQYLTHAGDDIIQMKIRLISYGELLSTTILTNWLIKEGIKPVLLHATHLVHATETTKKIDPESLQIWSEFRCRPELITGLPLVITQGFVARTADQRWCLMGRSGSDTTAAVLASGLGSKRVELWTDVPGIYTADPRLLPEAKLTPRISYSAAEELSAMGSYIVHPRAIYPCRSKKIPIHIKDTFHPDRKDTTIIGCSTSESNPVHSVSYQKEITLFSIGLFDMSGPGFMNHIYQIFRKHQVSVDLVTSSEDEITTTTKESSETRLEQLQQDLRRAGYRIRVIRNCAIVSIIANDTYKHPQLPEAHKLIKLFLPEHHYITHYSSNRQSLSFVVSEEIGIPLLRRFHHRFILKSNHHLDDQKAWWRVRREELQEHAEKHGNSSGLFVYDLNTLTERIDQLKTLTSVDQVFYAMKANWDPTILRVISNAGLGIETVSLGELNFVQQHLPEHPMNRVIFTPNYAAISEYQKALELGTTVIVDDVYLLSENPDVFRHARLGVRIDCDNADGHDIKVMTEGEKVKFGLPQEQIPEFLRVCQELEITLVGLHAHKGSGILDPTSWRRTAEQLMALIQEYDLNHTLEWLNLGGGLGVTTNGHTLDLERMNQELSHLPKHPPFWIEPGRFLVSEMGVLITPVTQIRQKRQTTYLGVAAGMNILIRPALYQAYHGIHRLRPGEKEKEVMINYQVVGPICESGDILGKDRLLPLIRRDDWILIENAGAYGRSMSSEYNLRPMPSILYLEAAPKPVIE